MLSKQIQVVDNSQVGSQHRHILSVVSNLLVVSIMTLCILSLVGSQTLIGNAIAPATNPSPKTTQANLLAFDTPMNLKEVNDFFSTKDQFQDLRSATLTTMLETDSHILPIQFEVDLKSEAGTKNNFDKAKQGLIDGINTAKKQPKLESKKYDRQALLKGFANPIQDPNNSNTKQYQPTESDLQYYEKTGYLPATVASEADFEAMKLPSSVLTPYNTPSIRGSWSNSSQEDVFKYQTAQQKEDRESRQEESITQQQILDNWNQKTENTLKALEPKITQIAYMTRVGDKSTQQFAKSKGIIYQNKLEQNESTTIQKLSKPSRKSDSKTQTNKAVSQDITSMFNVSEQEKNESKAKTNTEKQNVVNQLKATKSKLDSGQNIPKHQFNQMEADSYLKEGVDVEALGAQIIDKTTNSKIGLWESLFSVGILNTQAKGLNNTKNSLIMYTPSNTGVAINAPTNSNWQQLNLNYNGGYYNSQRWCFDNGNNKIYLTWESTCDGNWWWKKCLHALDGAIDGSRLGLYDCNWNNGGDNWQKWIFDEGGRLSLQVRPDKCVDAYGGNVNAGSNLVMWSCHSGYNQKFRAGYNNHGTGMGMTMWAADFGNFTYNQLGHAFVELWNNYGTHNTFSRWDFNDNDCIRYSYRDPYNNPVYLNNNTCDGDAITTDVELNQEYGLRNPKYNAFRKYGIYLDKSDWDNITFGSGHRNNYWNGQNVDMGGSGTYCYACSGASQSRNSNYNATYGYTDFYNVCSGYSIKLWNAYGGSNRTFNFSSPWVIGNPTPATIYYQI